MKPIKITGIGKYLPKRIIHSEELEQQWNLPQGWIKKHNGVLQRHRASKEETNAYMAARALEQALNKANLGVEQLDLIIAANGSFDYPIPHSACLIPNEMGKADLGIPCWNVDSTCLSFVTALDMASYLLDGKRYQRIAITSSEIASNSLNPQEPKSATLFGDAATAVIIEQTPETESSGIITAGMQTFSQGAEYTIVQAGGNRIPPRTTQENALFEFHMEGTKVMRLGIQKIVPFLEQLLNEVDTTIADLDLFIAHQASKMALEFAKKAFGLNNDQHFTTLENYGNCIAASIPLTLCDAIEQNRLQRGDKCLLAGTAAGLSVGGLLFVY